MAVSTGGYAGPMIMKRIARDVMLRVLFTAPLTRAERDEKFGEMVTYIRQDICRDCPSDCDDVEYYPCATVKALTIGKSEIVNEEEGE
jgi:hypothetical protein